MTQHEGHPPVAYLDKTKCYSKWVQIHIPFSGPHEARWVEDKDGTNGHWEGSVCDTEGNTIPGWQNEILWWEELHFPLKFVGFSNHGIHCLGCGGYSSKYQNRDEAYAKLPGDGWLQLKDDDWICDSCLPAYTALKLPKTDHWEGRVELPPQLAPLEGMSVNYFKTFYTEYIAQFRKKMEEGSQIAGSVPDKPGNEPKHEIKTVDTSIYGLSCFDCRKHITLPFSEKEGWRYQCKEGRDTKGANPMTCPGGDVQRGFQIGGYYTHMWFETDGSLVSEGATNDPCLTWMIASDGEFPTEDGEVGIRFHLCDFTQLEAWVAFWGKELRKRGWITEDDNAE